MNVCLSELRMLCLRTSDFGGRVVQVRRQQSAGSRDYKFLNSGSPDWEKRSGITITWCTLKVSRVWTQLLTYFRYHKRWRGTSVNNNDNNNKKTREQTNRNCVIVVEVICINIVFNQIWVSGWLTIYFTQWIQFILSPLSRASKH